jgi:uncharacterized membrane protein
MWHAYKHKLAVQSWMAMLFLCRIFIDTPPAFPQVIETQKMSVECD